jgi:hypothetical protein
LLSNALDGGQSTLKTLHISGKYDGGDFISSAPFELSVRHMDAVGILQIASKKISANIDMVLRGTSPAPAPISLKISDDIRDYSLSEIMRNFDPDFFREFTKTHNLF